MSRNSFSVPKLVEVDCWMDMRGLPGGYGWRGDRSIGSINTLITHHTVTAQKGNAKEEVEGVLRHHRNRGWGGIGYHFLITSEIRNGYAVVAYVGDVGSIRAHAINAKNKPDGKQNAGNYYSLGFSFIGNHQNAFPKEEMLKSARLLVDEFLLHDKRFTGLSSKNQLKGHGAWDYTWCPDGDEGTVLNPIILNIITDDMSQSEYQVQLDSANEWNETVGKKFGFKILHKVDESTMSRNDFMIALHRYNIYLRKSGNDDLPPEIIQE